MAASDQRKGRIIAHMNRGHARELSHYLQHYVGASAAAASSPTLSDMSLDRMIITSHGRDFTVPFSPPLATLDEARERLIAMDVEARGALGISDVVIDEWVAPTGVAALTLGSILFYYGCYFTLPWTTPGSPAFRALDPAFPGGASTFRWIVKTIFWPVIVIHVTEAVIFAKTRMHKYSVPKWSRVWWLWVINCFIVGYPTFQGIDHLAARKKAEKDAKSH
jgi:hypothetical protein